MGAMVNDDADAEIPDPVRVLLADDEALMRAGLRLMVDGARGIEVVGEASDGDVAVDQAAALTPDVILMDIRMPRMSGIEAVRALREAGSSARVVMLTAFGTDEFLLRALREGAVSFLLKDAPPGEVVQSVLDAAADRARFSPDVLARLVRLASGGPGQDGIGPAAGAAGAPSGPGGSVGSAPTRPTDAAPGGPTAASSAPDGVTDREWEVGRLLAQGLTNREIGEQLFLSIPTVKTHLGRLFHKLQATNRVQLAIRVLELGG